MLLWIFEQAIIFFSPRDSWIRVQIKNKVQRILMTGRFFVDHIFDIFIRVWVCFYIFTRWNKNDKNTNGLRFLLFFFFLISFDSSHEFLYVSDVYFNSCKYKMEKCLLFGRWGYSNQWVLLQYYSFGHLLVFAKCYLIILFVENSSYAV